MNRVKKAIKKKFFDITKEKMSESTNIANTDDSMEVNNDIETEPLEKDEEWIWIEGYKGTDENLTCREYQYKLHHLHEYSGEVETYSNGFHLSLNKNGAFDNYPMSFKNRFFKVQALVKRSEYERLKRNLRVKFVVLVENVTIAAKKIVFLRELEYKDVVRYTQIRFPFIENAAEYNNMDDYSNFAYNKFIAGMLKLGFSKTFAKIQYYEIKEHLALHKYYKRAVAYTEEGLSQDMKVYLLEMKK